MGRLGMMGMCVPEEWGGAGADFTSYSLAMEEVAAGWAAASSVMSVNNSPMCSALLDWGSDEQKERFLRPMAQGAVGCFCLTEPACGLGCRCHQDPGGTEAWQPICAERGKAVHHVRLDCRNTHLSLLSPTPLPANAASALSSCRPRRRASTVVAKEKKLGQRALRYMPDLHSRMSKLTPDMLLGEEGQGYRIALGQSRSPDALPLPHRQSASPGRPWKRRPPTQTSAKPSASR